VTEKDAKRPPGRPALPPEEAKTAMIRERVTEAQRAEYEQRGGKAWLVRELSRKFIGVERETKYFEIACERIEMAQAQATLFEPAAKADQHDLAL